MHIRPATNGDAEAVRRVLFDVLAEYGLVAEHEGVDADLGDIEGNYAGRGGVFDVVVDERGEVVGMVGLYARDEAVCELRKMYLRKEARGQGWGRTLLERMVAEARRRGFTRMELETSSKLTEAIRLYRRNGFRPLAASHCALRCDEAYSLALDERGGLST